MADIKGSQIPESENTQPGDMLMGIRKTPGGNTNFNLSVTALLAATNGAFMGLAEADTNPGVPSSPRYYQGIAGTTYPYFKDVNNLEINIPSKVGTQYVVDVRLIWHEGHWIPTWGLIDDLIEFDDTGESHSTDIGASANSVRKVNEKIDDRVAVSSVTSYALAIVDADDKILAYFDEFGKFRAYDWVNSSIPQSALKSLSITLANLTENIDLAHLAPDVKRVIGELLDSSQTGYALAIVDDENKVLVGVKVNGESWIGGINVTALKTAFETLTQRVEDIASGVGATKEVQCKGDSLTAGAGGGGTSYPGVLQQKLGSKFIVSNNGVGGENVPTIMGRLGGVPMVISNDITLPSSTTEGVVIGTFTPYRLIKNILGTDTKVLLQSNSDKINPVMIAGVECRIVRTGDVQADHVWTLFRNLPASDSTIIKAGEIIIPVKARTLKKGQIGVIFVGQNGGYDTDATLIKYINSLIKYYQYSDYVVVGLTSGTRAERAAYETAMTQEYGLRFLRTREYLSTYGLQMAGIPATAQDIADMTEGKTPNSLLSDGLHFNAAGYNVLGELIYRRFKELNIA